MAMRKQETRWDWIETQWQRGTLSNVQIAKLHEEEFGSPISEGAIRKRVSSYGWQRDISEAIRRETRNRLAKGEVRESTNQSTRVALVPESLIVAEEAAIVERAADALVTIETDQRVKLARLSLLTDRMEAYAFAMLPVDEDDGTPKLTYEPGELKDLLNAAAQSVTARVKVITTERKVYGMDAPDESRGGSGGDGGVTVVVLPDNGRSSTPRD